MDMFRAHAPGGAGRIHGGVAAADDDHVLPTVTGVVWVGKVRPHQVDAVRFIGGVHPLNSSGCPSCWAVRRLCP